MRMNPKLRIHMLHMRFHRVARYHELLLDVFPVAAAGQHGEHLALARREAAAIANGSTPFFKLLLGSLRLGLLNQRNHSFYGSREAEILQPYQGVADEKKNEGAGNEDCRVLVIREGLCRPHAKRSSDNRADP